MLSYLFFFEPLKSSKKISFKIKNSRRIRRHKIGRSGLVSLPRLSVILGQPA